MDASAEIKTLSAKEKELIQKVLAKTGWDLAEAARLLQIPLAALRQKIRAHDLNRDAES